jgi:acetyl esterase/lipase
MRLWPEEFEALRPEARAAVKAGTSVFPSREGMGELTPVERVARLRADMLLTTFTVDGTEEQQLAGVRCRIFRPDGDARAIYLHFHGGGMVSGAPEMMDLLNQSLAKHHGVAVVSVDYRKAPEHPHPAGPDDGIAVARWLLDNGEKEFGAARMLIGGESAGGYMTAITALRIRDELGCIDRVDGLNLIFGVYDWSGTPSQKGKRPADEFDLLDPDGIAFIAECYAPGRTTDERRAPDLSPLYSDLRGLPPCLVSVGSTDHLLDDSLLFATRAAAAGVDVDLFVAPDLPHGFIAFDCEITRRWFAHQSAWIDARLAG